MKDRTYKYFSGKPLYGFGYGLSYTTFAYSNLKLPGEVKAGDPATVTVEVKNTGSIAGDEVVQLYLTQPKGFETPLRKLAGFKRVRVGPGESQTVSVTVGPRPLGQVNAKGDLVILPGQYTVSVGGAQPQDAASKQTGKFNVSGNVTLPK
jgi:beta-glucosidase